MIRTGDVLLRLASCLIQFALATGLCAEKLAELILNLAARVFDFPLISSAMFLLRVYISASVAILYRRRLKTPNASAFFPLTLRPLRNGTYVAY